jgi:cell division protein FtsL
MKKSAKPFIVKILLLLVVSAVMILLNVGLRFKNEDLIRRIVQQGKKLNEESTKKVNLIAEFQAFSSEERIVSIAENKLEMKRRTQPKITVKVDKKLIDKINKELESKYE